MQCARIATSYDETSDDDAVVITHDDVAECTPQPSVDGGDEHKEAPPGIGIKLHKSERGRWEATVAVKASQEYKKQIDHVVVIAVDNSGSMAENGGEQGVRQMLRMIPTYADKLKENGNTVAGKVLFFSESVKEPDTDEARRFTKLSDWSDGLVKHLISRANADGRTNIEAATAASLSHLLAQQCDDSTALSVILMTDGMPTLGLQSASEIRDMLVDQRGDRPVQFHTIAMGGEPRAEWLKTYIGSDGVMGYAPTLEHVGEAFEKVAGTLNAAHAIFAARVSVTRRGEILHNKVHQLGFKSTTKEMTQFHVGPSLTSAGLELEIGDVVKVVSMGEEESVTVGTDAFSTRTDLWNESDLQARVDSELLEAEHIVYHTGSIEDAIRRLQVATDEKTPRAVRALKEAVYRSLSASQKRAQGHDDEEDGEDGEGHDSDADQGPTYHSLGGGIGKRRRRVRKGRSMSAPLATLHAFSASRYS